MSQKRKLSIDYGNIPNFLYVQCLPTMKKYASEKEKQQYEECNIKVCKLTPEGDCKVTFYSEEDKSRFILKYL